MEPTDPSPAALTQIREEIDCLDERIVELMAARLDLARATLGIKSEHGLDFIDRRREADVVRRGASRARAKGLEPELVREIFWRVIELSKTSPAGDPSDHDVR